MRTETIEGKRPHTKTRDCPACHRSFEFWHTSGMSTCAPHFYCGKCSNVIWRARDWDIVERLGSTDSTAMAIVETLPPCGCGDRFSATSGPKCPHCGFLFEHQHTIATRLEDPRVVLVDRATFYFEGKEDAKQ